MPRQSLEEMEDESEQLDAELTLAEKRAKVEQYKKLYGKDWKRMIGDSLNKFAKGLKTNMHEPPSMMRNSK